MTFSSSSSSQFFTHSLFSPALYLEIPAVPNVRLPSSRQAPPFSRQHIKLHPVLMDTAFCLLEMLVKTKHGELLLKSSGNSQHNSVDVYLQFGVTYRYHLQGEQHVQLRKIYEQMNQLKVYGDYHHF